MIVHSLKPRKAGKYNRRITLCNKSLGWTKPVSNDPKKITCKCCRDRRIEIIEKGNYESRI